MSSFTYTVWSDFKLAVLLERLQFIFDALDFTLENPSSGKVNLWSEKGETFEIDLASLSSIADMELPIGIQWWRGDDDIYVSVSNSSKFSGLICYVTLVGLSREEKAEIARLLILHITPEKQLFPDDFYVFQLSAQ